MQIWQEQGQPLPQDLCRLLVVSQGNTQLTSGPSDDGVDHDMLHDLLSGQKAFDAIAGRLSGHTKTAVLAGGEISGHGGWPELKRREDVREEITQIEQLLARFNDHISHGRIAELTARCQALKERILQQHRARQRHADFLDTSARKLDEAIARLPSIEAITELSTEISAWRRADEDGAEQARRIDEESRPLQHLAWAENALTHYQRILEARPPERPPAWFTWAAAAAAAAAVVGGLAGERWILAVMSLLAVALLLVSRWREQQRQQPESDDPQELEKIEAEFERRFERPLGDRATLETAIDQLKSQQVGLDVRAQQARDSKQAQRVESDRIAQVISGWVGEDVPPAEWTGRLESLRNELKEVIARQDALRRESASLGVDPSGSRVEESSDDWNPRQFAQLEAQRADAESELADETRKQETLLSEARGVTGVADESDWKPMLEALENRLDQLHTSRRDLTAQLIAQKLVHDTLTELSEIESDTVSQGLSQPEMSESLSLVCPRFVELRRHEKVVEVRDSEDEWYSVQSLSTGAREQLFLAMRLGLARIALDGDPAFLVLDDAFQHSDWSRREQMVKQVVELVKSGWQVLYFTMDDHIRDLFHDAGEILGDQFTPFGFP